MMDHILAWAEEVAGFEHLGLDVGRHRKQLLRPLFQFFTHFCVILA